MRRYRTNLVIAAIVATLICTVGIILWRSFLPDRTRDMEKAVQVANVVPIVVIGSGPAGLSAALYAARAAVYTVVFEGKTPGGQLTGTTYVENWPGTGKLLGSQLIEQNKKQAENFGAVMIQDTIALVDFSQWPFKLVTEDGHELHALAVVIATGAEPKLLNEMRKVPGEKEYWGYGVTTCAVCDAPFYKGKKVIVIGGGDSAVEEATLLTSYAESVTILVRGPAMRAAPAMRARIKESPKINVVYNAEIEEILGDGQKVTAVRLIHKQDKKTEELPVDGVFLAIGHRPNTALFKEYVKRDADGYIHLAGPGQATSVPGIFVAGDVADRVYRQAGVAAGDGIRAALDALSFLQKHGYNEKIAKKLERNFYEPHPETAVRPLEKIITMKDFDKVAKEHSLLVIDVGSEYCASCKALLPIVQSVAGQMGDKAHFVRIDLGDEPAELVKKFDIKAIPAILIIKQGKLVARYDQQLFTRRELAAVIQQLIG